MYTTGGGGELNWSSHHQMQEECIELLSPTLRMYCARRVLVSFHTLSVVCSVLFLVVWDGRNWFLGVHDCTYSTVVELSTELSRRRVSKTCEAVTERQPARCCVYVLLCLVWRLRGTPTKFLLQPLSSLCFSDRFYFNLRSRSRLCDASPRDWHWKRWDSLTTPRECLYCALHWAAIFVIVNVIIDRSAGHRVAVTFDLQWRGLDEWCRSVLPRFL